MTRRRIVILSLGAVLFAVVAYSGWQVYRAQRDLQKADDQVTALRAALDSDDSAARDRAIAELQARARSAHDHTSGLWWKVASALPFVGDDVEGVQAVASTLDTVAANGIAPVAATLDDLDGIVSNGRVDTARVTSLQAPLSTANTSFSAASRELSALESDGYVGAFRTRFDDYRDQIDSARDALASADVAAKALPRMLGDDGPRDYLLIFQNNAEIRATGGLPGSYAQLHAEGGKLSLVRQGAGSADFPFTQKSPLPLTQEEVSVYDQPLGQYFLDAGFTPDFPRAAELWNAHWRKKFPGQALDGVIALDPVAMSYLLGGTGPITIDGATYSEDNLVADLLNKPYLTLTPQQQDVLFQRVAKGLFDAMTGDIDSPVALVEGFQRAAREGRFLLAPFDAQDQTAVEDTSVLGILSGDDGETPHVDVGFNDATGSKMSYYLRYWGEVTSRSCTGGRQTLGGTVTLAQTISPADAAKLPSSITGGGAYGTKPGDQLLVLRLYGPYGGALDALKVDGSGVPDITPKMIDGRPVYVLPVQLSTTDDTVVTWDMSTGAGQTDGGELNMTPSVVPGSKRSSFASTC